MKSTPRTPSLSIQNPEGKFIVTDKAKADTISKWFEQRFTDTVVPLAPFVGPEQPLKQPITATEVESTMKLLQSGRAPGPGGVSNELLKYVAGTLSESFAEIINTIFEQHIALEVLGKGILVALLKPGKPLGLFARLRPIVLLNSVRKIASIITLQHSSQGCGFKQGRSCANIVWTQRMLGTSQESCQ